jgi:small GTP-binding protein
MSSVRKQKKLCVLGDFSVGKTSLVRRYVLDEFSDRYRATVGVKIYQYASKIRIDHEDVDIEQSIWDIEGSQFGDQLVTSYIAGASGAMIVGDLTREEMLASMTSHAQRFLSVLPGRPLVFALNKADLVPRAARAEGTALAREFGGDVLQTSALTGEDVVAVFHAMFRRMVEIGA